VVRRKVDLLGDESATGFDVAITVGEPSSDQ